MRQLRHLRWLILIGAGLALVGGLAWGQASARTQTGDIRADTMTLNWETRTFVFTGNCHLAVSGPYNATLSSNKMTVKLSPENDRVDELTADGPVDMKVISNPDAQGRRVQITATARDRAEYSESSQKITLRGNAQASMVSLPETAESQRASFSGEVMEANLKTSTLTLIKAQLRVSAPLPD